MSHTSGNGVFSSLSCSRTGLQAVQCVNHTCFPTFKRQHCLTENSLPGVWRAPQAALLHVMLKAGSMHLLLHMEHFGPDQTRSSRARPCKLGLSRFCVLPCTEHLRQTRDVST